MHSKVVVLHNGNFPPLGKYSVLLLYYRFGLGGEIFVKEEKTLLILTSPSI